MIWGERGVMETGDEGQGKEARRTVWDCYIILNKLNFFFHHRRCLLHSLETHKSRTSIGWV